MTIVRPQSSSSIFLSSSIFVATGSYSHRHDKNKVDNNNYRRKTQLFTFNGDSKDGGDTFNTDKCTDNKDNMINTTKKSNEELLKEILSTATDNDGGSTTIPEVGDFDDDELISYWKRFEDAKDRRVVSSSSGSSSNTAELSNLLDQSYERLGIDRNEAKKHVNNTMTRLQSSLLDCDKDDDEKEEEEELVLSLSLESNIKEYLYNNSKQSNNVLLEQLYVNTTIELYKDIFINIQRKSTSTPSSNSATGASSSLDVDIEKEDQQSSNNDNKTLIPSPPPQTKKKKSRLAMLAEDWLDEEGDFI